MNQDQNLKFIRSGKTGCVFASIMAKNPDKIGWKRIFNPDKLIVPDDAFIVSYIFDNKSKEEVLNWALENGMYLDITSKKSTGLRYKGASGVSWVQYFGQESHVKTRQTPNSELLFCVKLPKSMYLKVGFKGVLHLAHASVEHIKNDLLDGIWNACFKSTEKRLGYKPTVLEAAKTTYKNE